MPQTWEGLGTASTGLALVIIHGGNVGGCFELTLLEAVTLQALGLIDRVSELMDHYDPPERDDIPRIRVLWAEADQGRNTKCWAYIQQEGWLTVACGG